MQLTGDRFTSEAAAFGNDLATLPNFPAEIRAPAGTLPGVSSFQIHFADYDILTPGDRPDVLVAMNPAALKANVDDLAPGGTVIVNTDEFGARALAKVGYETNPLEDGSLERFGVHAVAMATLTQGSAGGDRAVEEGRRALQEHVRAGVAVVDVSPADRAARSGSCGRSSRAGRRSPRRTCWRSGRAGTTARPPSRSRSPMTSRRRSSRRAPTGRSRGTWRCPTGSWRPASVRGCRCSWAAIRSRRPRTSCTSCRSTRTSA